MIPSVSMLRVIVMVLVLAAGALRTGAGESTTPAESSEREQQKLKEWQWHDRLKTQGPIEVKLQLAQGEVEVSLSTLQPWVVGASPVSLAAYKLISSPDKIEKHLVDAGLSKTASKNTANQILKRAAPLQPILVAVGVGGAVLGAWQLFEGEKRSNLEGLEDSITEIRETQTGSVIVVSHNKQDSSRIGWILAGLAGAGTMALFFLLRHRRVLADPTAPATPDGAGEA